MLLPPKPPHPGGRPRVPLEARWKAKCGSVAPTSCIPWTGAKRTRTLADGSTETYGYMQGEKERTVLAHRVMWKVGKGEEAPKNIYPSTCKDWSCMNVEHWLEYVSLADREAEELAERKRVKKEARDKAEKEREDKKKVRLAKRERRLKRKESRRLWIEEFKATGERPLRGMKRFYADMEAKKAEEGMRKALEDRAKGIPIPRQGETHADG